MTLVHYSEEPFTLDQTRVYTQNFFKPNGLWLSVEGEDSLGWKEWCTGENFNLDGLKHRTSIVLNPSANILHLSSPLDIDEFSHTYRYIKPDAKDTWDLYRINWPRVAFQYDGIIIAPYIWERRNTNRTFWYYGWDCASACIWNCNIVQVADNAFLDKELTRMEKPWREP